MSLFGTLSQGSINRKMLEIGSTMRQIMDTMSAYTDLSSDQNFIDLTAAYDEMFEAHEKLREQGDSVSLREPADERAFLRAYGRAKTALEALRSNDWQRIVSMRDISRKAYEEEEPIEDLEELPSKIETVRNNQSIIDLVVSGKPVEDDYPKAVIVPLPPEPSTPPSSPGPITREVQEDFELVRQASDPVGVLTTPRPDTKPAPQMDWENLGDLVGAIFGGASETYQNEVKIRLAKEQQKGEKVYLPKGYVPRGGSPWLVGGAVALGALFIGAMVFAARR